MNFRIRLYPSNHTVDVPDIKRLNPTLEKDRISVAQLTCSPIIDQLHAGIFDC
jgi:hypothetical protein